MMIEALSFSKLAAYTRCGESVRLRYIERVPPAAEGALIGGRIVHDIIRRVETELKPDFELALYNEPFNDLLEELFVSLFAEEIEKAGGVSQIRWGGRKVYDPVTGKKVPSEDFNWWAKQGPAMVRRYLKVREIDALSGHRLWAPAEGEQGIEISLTTQLKSGRTISGRIDKALIVDLNGQLRIRDYKTGKSTDTPMQLANYAWQLRAGLGVTAEWGEYVYLRRADASARLKIHDLRPYVDLVEDQFNRAEKGIEAGVFMLNPSPFCVACQVRAGCAYGKTLENGEGDGSSHEDQT